MAWTTLSNAEDRKGFVTRVREGFAAVIERGAQLPRVQRREAIRQADREPSQDRSPVR